MAAVVVVGAGRGRPRRRRPAGRARARRHRLRAGADVVGGKLGRCSTRDGFVFDTGPSLLTLPAVYRDLFARDRRRRSRTSVAWCRVDPVCALPVRRRHRARPAERPARPASRRAWTPRSARRRRRLDGVWPRAPRGSGTRPARPFLESPLDGRRDLARLARRLRDLRTVAPWHDAARARAAVPARPAAADAARPVRHLHRLRPAPGPGRARRPCRTSSRPSAPGTSRGGLRHARRRGARAGRRRAA